MFAGKKSAQIREILISESAWEEMTCLFAPSLAKPVAGHDWVMGLAYGYIGLVVLSLSFINLLVKYDRVISLTEVALSRCDEVKGDVQG